MKHYQLSSLDAAFANGVIVSKRNGQILLTAVPRRRRGKPTDKQKHQRMRMRAAVRFARGIVNDPVRKAAWEKCRGKYTGVFQAVVAAFLKNQFEPFPQAPDTGHNKKIGK